MSTKKIVRSSCIEEWSDFTETNTTIS